MSEYNERAAEFLRKRGHSFEEVEAMIADATARSEAPAQLVVATVDKLNELDAVGALSVVMMLMGNQALRFEALGVPYAETLEKLREEAAHYCARNTKP